MNPRDSIIELLGFSALHTSNVKSMMIYVRELLEANQAKQVYPVLNFYANWCAHPELTASPVVLDMLLKITDVICESNSKPGTIDIWRSINDAFGVAQLRADLIKFLGSLTVPVAKFQDSDFWRGFCNLMFGKLKEKPLYLTDPKKLQKITDLAASKGQPDWAVDRLEIVKLGENLGWDISTADLRQRGVRMAGPLGLL
jgi:hypothetical protein